MNRQVICCNRCGDPVAIINKRYIFKGRKDYCKNCKMMAFLLTNPDEDMLDIQINIFNEFKKTSDGIYSKSL